MTDFVIILVVVLVAQNVVQTLAQTKLTAGSLELPPIVSFGSRISGGAVLGLLDVALSTPAAAIGISVTRRVDAAAKRDDVGD